MLSTEQALKIFQSMSKALSKIKPDREITKNIYHVNNGNISRLFATDGGIMVVVQINDEFPPLNSYLPIVNIEYDHETIKRFESVMNINATSKGQSVLLNGKNIDIAIKITRTIYKTMFKGEPMILINCTGENDPIYMLASKGDFYINIAMMPIMQPKKGETN